MHRHGSHHHDLSPRHAPLDGVLHRAPAGHKLLAAITLIILLVTLKPSWPLYAITAILLIALVALAKIPPLDFLKRLLLLEPFVLSAALLSLAHSGFHAFLFVVARSTLCVACLVLLAETTPFMRLLDVLRKARVPSLMVTTIALMYRYLAVTAEEARRMQRARASRTFTAARRVQWHSISLILSQLFLRASERSERIYAAMCSRGWR